MAYKQTRNFIQKDGGSVPYFCLRNVRMGYHIGAKYLTATIAWNHTKQHKNKDFPAGVAVPLYYRWLNRDGVDEGHINVRLPNGQIWNDGRIYPSLNAVLADLSDITYRGWGETINGVAVVAPVASAPKPSMPKINSRIQLIPTITRTTYVKGTTRVAGHIHATNNEYIYYVRGYDPKYPYRVIINSKSGGGNGIALALRYTNGKLISGWKQL
jgi:hypothetical protein